MSTSRKPKKRTPSPAVEVSRDDLLPVRVTNDHLLPTQGGYYEGSEPPPNGREQLAMILDMLYRRRWIIVACFVAIMGIAGVLTMMSEPAYEAESFVIVDLGRVTVDIARSTDANGMSGDAAFDLFARSDRTLASEIRLLRISDQLVQRVVHRLRPETVGEAWIPPPSLFPILQGAVRFESEAGSDNIIRFVGASAEADRAAELANIYAEEYVQLTRQASQTNTTAVQEALEAREQEQRAELDQVEEQIKRLEAGAIGMDQESARLIQQIAAIEMQYDDARVELEVEQAALASLERELETINPQLAQRIASGVENRIEALQTELAKEEDARARFLLEYPELGDRETTALNSVDERIRQLRTQIDSLSLQYVDEVAAAGGLSGSVDGLSYVAGLRQQIAEKRISVSRLEARMDVLEGRLSTYRTAMRNLPQQSMELAQLERTRLRVESRYQETMRQLQETYLANQGDPGYAQVIRRAQPPRVPVSPNSTRNLILGAFFGLMMGVVLAVVVDKIDNRIYQAEQLRTMGHREIGIVPDLKPLIDKAYEGRAFKEHAGHTVATSLVALHQPISAMSESYRYVRTNINFWLPDTAVQKLLITSPGMSEGKSTTAANIAVVMAQSGRRTLLIDADMRRPRQHAMFGLSLTSGLADVLARDAEPTFKETALDTLSVLTAGHLVPPVGDDTGAAAPTLQRDPPNPSELLGSSAMQALLQRVIADFDMVIVDSPPVLAVSDAPLLATQCDAAVVVVRAGVTKEGDLALALETIEDVGGTVLGILLNGFDIAMAYGHSYKYQHYGHYEAYASYGQQAGAGGD